MNFKDIITDIISEEFQNKKLLNLMLTKWYGPETTEEQKQEGEFLVVKFFELKNRFTTKLPEVITFLNKYENFDPTKIKEITNFTLPQIKFIVGEFFDLPNQRDTSDLPEILTGKRLTITNERVDESKKLWYSRNSRLIIESDGFRVYKINNRQDSIAFGFYQGTMARSKYFENEPYHMQWCTTRENEDNNLYGGYRNRRTFYFVIDESKNPEKINNPQISQYYLSALQYATDSPTSYRLTSILNDGSDPVVNENEIYKIYPQLKDQLDKIVKEEYSQEELGEVTDELDLVDERINNPNAFFRVSGNLKKRYIDSGKSITTSKSWQSMSDPLKTAYIDLTVQRTVFERFSTFDLIQDIKKRPTEVKSIDRRLKILGYDNGFGVLITKMMQTKFIQDEKVSITNNNISLFKDRVSNSYGLFNKELGDWINVNGLTYTPERKKIKSYLISPRKTSRFTVDVYSKSSNEGDDTFYVITPLMGDVKLGYFMSRQKWISFIEEYGVNTKAPDRDDAFIPNDEFDIKEISEF